MPIGKEMIRYEDEDNEWEETEASGQVFTAKLVQLST